MTSLKTGHNIVTDAAGVYCVDCRRRPSKKPDEAEPEAKEATKRITKENSISMKQNTLKSQQSRIERCEQGYTVVANGRRGVDTELIRWGRLNNFITPIGEGTKWGNPFEVERHTRDEHERVVALYRDWLPTQEVLIAASGYAIHRYAIYCQY
jgi:hypothetical protein